jgi:hypothetical protein
MATSGLETDAPTIPGVTAGLGVKPSLFFALPGTISPTELVSALQVIGGKPELVLKAKFIAKLKLGTRGILGKAGSLKLDLSCRESLIALILEFTISR